MYAAALSGRRPRLVPAVVDGGRAPRCPASGPCMVDAAVSRGALSGSGAPCPVIETGLPAAEFTRRRPGRTAPVHQRAILAGTPTALMRGRPCRMPWRRSTPPRSCSAGGCRGAHRLGAAYGVLTTHSCTRGPVRVQVTSVTAGSSQSCTRARAVSGAPRRTGRAASVVVQPHRHRPRRPAHCGPAEAGRPSQTPEPSDRGVRSDCSRTDRSRHYHGAAVHPSTLQQTFHVELSPSPTATPPTPPPNSEPCVPTGVPRGTSSLPPTTPVAALATPTVARTDPSSRSPARQSRAVRDLHRPVCRRERSHHREERGRVPVTAGAASTDPCAGTCRFNAPPSSSCSCRRCQPGATRLTAGGALPTASEPAGATRPPRSA